MHIDNICRQISICMYNNVDTLYSDYIIIVKSFYFNV